ncbi:MAG: hypothetical protein R3C15_03880 [Thermoleophilia bacterium]
MRKVALVLVVAAAAGAIGGGVAVAARKPSPARLLVTADEFSFVLSRQSILAGRAIVQLRNSGEDEHDLKLRKVGGSRTFAVPLARPGRTTESRPTLAPGTYRLWCAIGDHAARGMTATLVVRKRT